MLRKMALLVSAVLLFGATPPIWPMQAREQSLARVEAALNNYFYADRVAAIRDYLEKQRAKLLAADNPKTFAETLTAQLQEVSGDKHFIAWYSERVDENRTSEPSAAELADSAKFYRYVGEGHRVTARLQGNVGYLGLGGFAELQGAKATIDSAMRILADTDALIIDLRKNQGGDSDTVDYLLGYFFATPTVIADISQRTGGKLVSHHENSAVDVGWRRYLEKHIYILVAKQTISGGEFFAYTMQSLHRATVVGGATAGAANGLGSPPVFISDHIRLSVPDTRIVNPYTHANWENGVQPDVAIASSEALLYAYTHALRQVPQSYDPTGGLGAALANPALALRDSFPQT
jgi:hypothetical protein